MRIVIIGRLAGCLKEALQRELGAEHELVVFEDPALAEQNLYVFDQAEVIIGGPLTKAIVGRAKRLKLVHAPGAGVDNLGYELLPAGVQVAHTHHHERSIAEHVVMSILMLVRQPWRYDQALRQGRWTQSFVWSEGPAVEMLAGRTAMILGMGRIGREVARRLRPFDVRIVGVTHQPELAREVVDEALTYRHWEERLPEIDFLVVACALTPETRGLIGERQLSQLKRGAYLINVARGEIVDERALYEALSQGRLAGAAIDVWYRYPKVPGERILPSEYPFESLPNVLMTPHISGWTRETLEGRVKDIVENIRRLLAGRELVNVVGR